MLFGSTPLIEVLSWIVVVTLGAKLAATIVLLAAGKDTRNRAGWGAALWWLTKVTPLIAVPCAIAVAWLLNRTDQVWLFIGMLLFVVVAVPLKVRQRRARLAGQASSTPHEV